MHCVWAGVLTLGLCNAAGYAQDGLPVDWGQDSTAALATFPYCQCNDYRCKASPYRLRLGEVGPSGTSGKLDKICYNIEMVSAIWQFCSRMQISGLLGLWWRVAGSTPVALAQWRATACSSPPLLFKPSSL